VTRNPARPRRRSTGMDRKTRIATFAGILLARHGAAAARVALERARASRIGRDYGSAMMWLEVVLSLAAGTARPPRGEAAGDLAYARTLARPPEARPPAPGPRRARGLAAFARRLKAKRRQPH
jgi:hypothetical protein